LQRIRQVSRHVSDAALRRRRHGDNYVARCDVISMATPAGRTHCAVSG